MHMDRTKSWIVNQMYMDFMLTKFTAVSAEAGEEGGSIIDAHKKIMNNMVSTVI